MPSRASICCGMAGRCVLLSLLQSHAYRGKPSKVMGVDSPSDILAPAVSVKVKLVGTLCSFVIPESDFVELGALDLEALLGPVAEPRVEPLQFQKASGIPANAS